MRIVFTLFLSVFLMAQGATIAGAETAGQLHVSGQGQVLAAPDIAVISIGVTREASEAADAMAAMNGAASAVMARVAEMGVAPQDMQTSNLRLDPVHGSSLSGARSISGYQASNTLTLRVRNLEDLGVILGAVVSDGANQLFGLSFDISDPGPLRDEARRLAVADAAARAAVLAEAAGVTLGPLVRLQEAGSPSARPMMADARQFSSEVAVAGGELGISASVTLIYEIRP